MDNEQTTRMIWRLLAKALAVAALLAPQSMALSIVQTVGGPKPICAKDAPAKGNVPDAKWAFSYLSWAEPYATDASLYVYQFVNRTDHSVPVRWMDAQIVKVKTIPDDPVQSNVIDALPSGLRVSAIAVGPEGARERKYSLPNCLSLADPKRRLEAYRRYGSALRFRGRVASARSETFAFVDIEFKASVDKMLASFNTKYEMINRSRRGVVVAWEIPGVRKEPTVVPVDIPTEWGLLSNASLRSGSARATLSDQESKEELVVLSVPVLIGDK